MIIWVYWFHGKKNFFKEIHNRFLLLIKSTHSTYLCSVMKVLYKTNWESDIMISLRKWRLTRKNYLCVYVCRTWQQQFLPRFVYIFFSTKCLCYFYRRLRHITLIFQTEQSTILGYNPEKKLFLGLKFKINKNINFSPYFEVIVPLFVFT